MLALFAAGLVAFIISTISGGGGALLLLPVTESLIGASATAPVVQLANFIGRPVRLVLFWREIDWKVVRYYLPAALVGGLLGTYLFSRMDSTWIRLLLGLFLISTVFQYRFGKKERSFPMRVEVFGGLGFGVALLSSLVGGLGPVLNPFYLNYGLDKEPMIATKTANAFFVGIVQLGGYAFFGALTGHLWEYGLAMGLGAALGNYVGKRLLGRMSSRRFRQFVIALMVISGGVMVWRALSGLVGW